MQLHHIHVDRSKAYQMHLLVDVHTMLPTHPMTTTKPCSTDKRHKAEAAPTVACPQSRCYASQ